jgi:serine/threonine protein kinase
MKLVVKLNVDSFIGLEFPPKSGFKIIEFIAKGCNALVFKAYSEVLQKNKAYKVIPKEKLAGDNVWRLEPIKANSLDDQCVVKCQNQYDWKEKNSIVLEYDFIDGFSLKDYIKNCRDDVSIPFIIDLLRTILPLFHELISRGITHGDIHTGNILVKKSSSFQLKKLVEFKVTDFGAGILTSNKPFDDFDGLASIISQLLQCIDYQSIPPKEKFLYNELNDNFCGKYLLEKDYTLNSIARQPSELIICLEGLDKKYIELQNKVVKKSSLLLTPFDYLNCEQIGTSHTILKALYSDKFLGLSEVESAYNLVITGPRGCGKSTIFKSLSLKHKYYVDDIQDISNEKYVGVYYHCNDLYFKLPRYKIPSREDALDLPSHYFSCRLIIEILETIQLATETSNYEATVSSLIWELLPIKKPEVPNADSFNHLISSLTKDCQRVVKKNRFSNDPSHDFSSLSSPDLLSQVCQVLIDQIGWLSRKPIYFFIDDYSSPHISMSLQKNLNRIIMQRSASCFFKVSTESPVSFSSADIDGKNFVEGREYEMLNLGIRYIREDSTRKKEFLEDVFRRRLAAVGTYPVKTLHDLLGESEYKSSNEVARKIVNGEKIICHGVETLSDMCSGDIHSMISIVKMMEEKAGGTENLKPKIPAIRKDYQNDAIRTYAGRFLTNLNNTGENGKAITKVVEAFGNVAASYLKHKTSKNGENNPPYQAARIELHTWPNLQNPQKSIYDDLLRYSVFIQDPRGKSIRGVVVPRLYMRRFLIPHFNLTFSGRDSIRMTEKDLLIILSSPDAYEKDKRITSKKDDGTKIKSHQPDLDFGDL